MKSKHLAALIWGKFLQKIKENTKGKQFPATAPPMIVKSTRYVLKIG
jgi:hypothetical protein